MIAPPRSAVQRLAPHRTGSFLRRDATQRTAAPCAALHRFATHSTGGFPAATPRSATQRTAARRPASHSTAKEVF